MALGRWHLERPPRASRPLFRLGSPFIGLLGMAGFLPVIIIIITRIGPRPMMAYVIGDLLVIGIVMILRLRFMRRLKAKLRAADGALCPDCGYDLRGLAEKGDCPECGRAFEREADMAFWRRHVNF